MAINWNMGGPQNNALAYFQFGNQLGTQVRERQDERKKNEALAKVMTRNPGQTPGIGDGDPRLPQNIERETAMNDLMRLDPRTALQVRQMQREESRVAQEQQQKQTEQRRADIPLIGRLLDHATDETTYQQARQVAGQYGIDVSQLPEAYDPAWVEQTKQTVKVLSDPAKLEALSAAGKIAADMGFKPGTPEYNAKVGEIWTASEAKPYVVGGETKLYQPKIGGPGQAIGGGVSEGATATNPQTGEKIIYQGGQWVPMGQGGGGSRVTGNFLDGL